MEPIRAGYSRPRQVFTLAFAGLVVLRFALWTAADPARWQEFAGILAVPTVLALALLGLALRLRLDVDHAGIHWRPMLGAARTIAWQDVQSWEIPGSTGPFPDGSPPGWRRLRIEAKAGPALLIPLVHVHDREAVKVRVVAALRERGIPEAVGRTL